MSTPEAKKVQKWVITMLSLAEEIGSLICNCKTHNFSCCFSANKTRGIRFSMKHLPLLFIIANTVLVNKYQPYSKLNPVLFLRHFEK